MEWVAVAALIGLAFCWMVGLLASRKGYEFFLWFFAAGIPALLILAFLSSTNKPDMPPEIAARKRATGNWIGGVLAGLNVLVTILLVMNSRLTRM